MKIYVASSWRNAHQPDVVEALRCEGHIVYDFKSPEWHTGFSWNQIELDPQGHDFGEFARMVRHDTATIGFMADMSALRDCDACVLVLPSGRSAHIEAGFAKGAGKRLLIYVPEYDGPDLMWLMADCITDNLEVIRSGLRDQYLARDKAMPEARA